MRLSQTRRGQKKEKKGTLTTTILYSDHIARSFYSIFFIDRPTNQRTILYSLKRTTSAAVRAQTMMNEEERKEEERTNERTSLYAREKGVFFFFFFFFFLFFTVFEL
jgi:hypothetical protein